MTLRGFFLVSLVSFLAPACSAADGKSDRCVSMKSELSACVGTSFNALDCSAVSDADINRLSALTQGGSCALLAGALPTDGDPQSITCKLLDVGCVASVTKTPARAPTTYPILLVNGIDTSPLFRYSDRIVKTMTEIGGHRVFLATLTPYETPQRRAPELWARIQEVRKTTGAAKVNLICHSLGGLDCRYAVSPHGLRADTGADVASTVASITTVGTAHRGTRIADVLLGLAPDGDRGKMVDNFATLVGDWFSDHRLESDLHLKEALRALSTANAPAFNAEVVDAPGIYYQSWGGFSRPFGMSTPDHDARVATECRTTSGEDGNPNFTAHDYMALTLIPFTDVVGRVTEGSSDLTPNDGLTALSSAKWGNFRGCIPADHMEQLGQRNIPDVNVRTGFDVARFYTNVADDLQGRGY